MAEGKELSLKERAALHRLDKPEDLKTVLARENEQYDCLSCRVMGKPYIQPTYVRICTFPKLRHLSGASAFIGLGAYTYWSGHRQLRLNEKQILNAGKVGMAARSMGITGLAATLIGLGAYRAFA